MSQIRVAHISDPHFTQITFSPSQFLNKRWLGNLNQILFRKYQYQTNHLSLLPAFFSKLGVDHVLLTGDISSLSLDAEFRKARQFLDSFHPFSIPVHHLPGNHDAYTKQAEMTRQYFKFLENPDLREYRIELKRLSDQWWWLAIDCSCASGLIESNGLFFPEMDAKVLEAIEKVPSGEKIIFGNHFPLIGSGRPTHDLRRSKFLAEILKKSPKVKLYLHGHDHLPYIINRQREKLPLIFNAGSCAKINGGTFYLIDLFETHCYLKRFRFSKSLKDEPWVVDMEQSFSFFRN